MQIYDERGIVVTHFDLELARPRRAAVVGPDPETALGVEKPCEPLGSGRVQPLGSRHPIRRKEAPSESTHEHMFA